MWISKEHSNFIRWLLFLNYFRSFCDILVVFVYHFNSRLLGMLRRAFRHGILTSFCHTLKSPEIIITHRRMILHGLHNLHRTNTNQQRNESVCRNACPYMDLSLQSWKENSFLYNEQWHTGAEYYVGNWQNPLCQVAMKPSFEECCSPKDNEWKYKFHYNYSSFTPITCLLVR